MSLTVWKFTLGWGEFNVSMPELATVLHVGKDPVSDYPAVWALVTPGDTVETRRFAVVRTGHNVPNGIFRPSVAVGGAVTA